MEKNFLEMANTILISIDHYRECGRDDKFNADSIATVFWLAEGVELEALKLNLLLMFKIITNAQK